jgi:hypothetical protein
MSDEKATVADTAVVTDDDVAAAGGCGGGLDGLVAPGGWDRSAAVGEEQGR